MPLYEYRCKNCNRVFEKIVSFSEANKNPVCPECQSQETERKLSRIAAIGSSGGASTSGGSCGSGGGFT